MTQPIFRLVENTFYLEDNFESSEDYRVLVGVEFSRWHFTPFNYKQIVIVT